MKKLLALLAGITVGITYLSGTPALHASDTQGKKRLVAFGGSHSCAVTPSGGIKCWGVNNLGELGIGYCKKGPKQDGPTRYSDAPMSPVGISNEVAAVSVGYAQTCIITKSGGVKCWGSNQAGALGIGIDKDCPHTACLPESCFGTDSMEYPASTKPVNVKGLSSGVIDVDIGSLMVCAVMKDGKLKCWGYMDPGQSIRKSVPTDIPGISGAKSVSVSTIHACALLSSGEVKCWGGNEGGQIGNGTVSELVKTPVTVKGILDAVDIATGSYHTCAVLSSGEVKCWGCNVDSALGVSDESLTETEMERKDWKVSTTPVTVPGITDAVQIEAGGTNTCVLTSQGSVKCWGVNFEQGQVVEGLESDIVSIAVEGYTVLGMTSDGKVKCIGQNTGGMCGQPYNPDGEDISPAKEVPNFP